MAIHIMWFRRDLRLEDNTAFSEALTSLTPEDKLLCIFHINDQQLRIGTNSHDYFFSTLDHFISDSSEQHLTIHLLTGNIIDAFDALLTIYSDTTHIFFNIDNRGFGRKRDLAVTAFLESKNIQVNSYEENHLHQATEIQKPDGTHYKMFTPYYKKWRQLSKGHYQKNNLTPYLDKVIHQPQYFEMGTQTLNNLLNNRQTDFSSNVGETQANTQLNTFIMAHLEHYDINRDYPFLDSTSRLSPYLSTGAISIRKVYQACQSLPDSDGKETFIKELAWRDFYHMIYFYYPNQYQEELKEKYQQLPWQQESLIFEKWKIGQTGYPIIDAAMRQLNETGWMHNRLRMLVASFLTKDLLIDWRLGERYFSEQLIDFDSASNIGGWQWAASTGTDAVPYFRIFNPITQGIKFDKEAEFIKKFVPELTNLPVKYCHEPWLLSETLQHNLAFKVGVTYPSPVVDHKMARDRALEWFKESLER